MKKIKARNGNVVLKARPANVRDSGIVIAGESDDRQMYVVESVGEGYLNDNGTRVPINLKRGDVCFIAPGTTVAQLEDPAGGHLLIVTESAIIAIEEDDGVPNITKASLN